MMHQRDNQMMHQRGNQMVNDLMFDLMFDRMMEQRQDDNQRQYMRRQDGRMNNFYSYERMLQRQNEARRNMNNRHMNMNNQHRMFKREADSSFEYDVVAEHDNNQMSRNQQMMDVMIRPQQDNQMDSRMHQMDSRRNQMDSRQVDQYNMNNQMD